MLPFWLAVLLCVLSPGAVAINANIPKLYPDGKIGIIGPSLAAATNSSQMCENSDAFDCIRDELGVHSREWSYAGGQKSWSIASLLGFDQDHVVDASDDGEEWKDALAQATTIMADPAVEAVFIMLGGNNVCERQGHDYTGDLEQISAQIDSTLLFLTDSLPPGGRIYWSGLFDVTQLRNSMAKRDHNYWFENCQAVWDLNGEKIKDSAAEGICDHFFDNRACQAASFQEEAKDQFMELFVNRVLERETIDEGPCGKVLSSQSTAQDVEEARQFTLSLNELMADKAREYNGRNGVIVYYHDRLFNASAKLKPYHVSRLDCFHPNRSGQYLIASEVWKGFNASFGSVGSIFFDEFDSQDYCAQEFTNWETCWTEIGEGSSPVTADIQINLGELRIRDNGKGIMRGLNLDGVEEAWISFNFRREELDRNGDYVTFDASPDAGQTWFEIDRFQGDANDYNMHRGYYYDITPYATAATMIRFVGSSGLGSDDRVYFDNVKVMSWMPPGDTDGDGLPNGLVAASLPSSRSVQVGNVATAFASIINVGTTTATECSIGPGTPSVPADFAYQMTDASNAPVGARNTPIDIPAGAPQTFLVAFTPTVEIAPTDIRLSYECTNTEPAPPMPGVNTLLLSASSTPAPDIVALSTTATGNGIVALPESPGSNAFAVATVNVGSQDMLTASADTGTAALPVTLSICESDPLTGECLLPPATSVTTTIATDATPTFSIFVTGTGTVPFDPANNRIFVHFKDLDGVTRGSTSVAVQTE